MTTVSVKGENYDIKVSANVSEQDLVCAVSDFIENIHTIEKQDEDAMLSCSERMEIAKLHDSAIAPTIVEE